MSEELRVAKLREQVASMCDGISNNKELEQALQKAHAEQVARGDGRSLVEGGAANSRLMQRLADEPALLSRGDVGLSGVFAPEDPVEYLVPVPSGVHRSSS